MFDSHVLKVLIASPSDTRALRDSVEQSLHAWNTERAETASVMLLPRRWETAAVPVLDGADGQSVINAQLVDDVDIVVVLFHQTLGTATSRAASGTAEELGRARDAGKPVHVYFSDAPIDRDHDRAQLAALDEFRKSVAGMGLYSSFGSTGDLEKKIRAAVEHDIREFGLQPPSVKTVSGASLSARYAYEREPDRKGRMTTRRERLVVTNGGSAAAEDVTLILTSLEDGLDAPHTYSDGGAFTVAADGGSYSVPLLTHSGTATRVNAQFDWSEGGLKKNGSHTVSLF